MSLSSPFFRMFLLFLFSYPILTTATELKVNQHYEAEYCRLEQMLANNPADTTIHDGFIRLRDCCNKEGFNESGLLCELQLLRYWIENNHTDEVDSLALSLDGRLQEGKHDFIRMHLDNDYGCYLNARQQFDDALSYLHAGYELANELNQSETKAALLAELAYGYLFLEKYDQATRYNQLALKEAIQLKDTLLMLHAHNKAGLIHKRCFAFNRSIEEYKKALELNEVLEDKYQSRVLLNNIASLYTELGKNEEALQIQRSIFKYHNLDANERPEDILQNTILFSATSALLNNCAHYEWGLDSARHAMKYFDYAIPNGLKMVVYYNVANSFSHLKQPDSTYFYLKKAEEMVAGSRNLRDVANMWYLYGGCMEECGNLEKARECYRKGADIFRKLNMSSGVFIELLDKWSTLEASTFKNPLGAYELQAEKNQQVKKRYELDFEQKVAAYKVEFDTQEKELEIARLEAKQLEDTLSYTRRRNIFILILIFAVSGFVVLILYLRNVRIGNRLREEKLRMDTQVKINTLNDEIGKLTDQQHDHYIEGLEYENKRLSKELHDGLCNRILSLEMQLSEKLDAQALLHIRELREEARSLSHELAKPIFTETSLLHVLSQYVERLNQIPSVAVHSYLDQEVNKLQLPEKVQVELYRMIQEIINNMLRHAHASNIYITLNSEAKCLNLIVEDDGVGFDPTHVKKGLGLRILQERADSIHADFTIHSAPGKGTIVHTSINMLHYAEEKISDIIG